MFKTAVFGREAWLHITAKYLRMHAQKSAGWLASGTWLGHIWASVEVQA